MKTKKVAAVFACVAVLVAIVVGFGVWQPWADADGESETPDEILGGDVTPTGEEWPGQSKGYVGPNGEGSLKDYEYSTNEEYFEIVESAGNGVEHEVPAASEGWTGEGCQPGVLLVFFDPNVSEYEAHQVIESHGGLWCSDEYFFLDDLDVMVTAYFGDVTSVEELRAKADELAADPAVSGAGLNAEGLLSEGEAVSVNAVNTVASASSLSQYYLTVSRFYDAWKVVTCDHMATIAILDSGFDLDHEDLSANMALGWDASKNCSLTEDVYESGGHGTMVAGVASAVSGTTIGIDGASHDAWILPIRISDDDGHLLWGYVVSALGWIKALPSKPTSVNMSFEFHESIVTQEQIDSLQALVTELSGNYKIVLVAASGNLRVGESLTDIKYPAALDEVISVGSVNAANAIASDSNRNEYVDICAPGVSVYSTAFASADNLGLSYGTMSGTSFAAPQVAAAAALLKVQHPSWNVAQVEARLESTAVDLGASGRDDEYGYGLLDAASAVGWVPSTPVLGGSFFDAYRELEAGR